MNKEDIGLLKKRLVSTARLFHAKDDLIIQLEKIVDEYYGREK